MVGTNKHSRFASQKVGGHGVRYCPESYVKQPLLISTQKVSFGRPADIKQLLLEPLTPPGSFVVLSDLFQPDSPVGRH